MLEVVHLAHQVDYFGEVGALDDGFGEGCALLSCWLVVQDVELGLLCEVGLGAKVLQLADDILSSLSTRTVFLLTGVGFVLLDDLVVLLSDLVDLSL